MKGVRGYSKPLRMPVPEPEFSFNRKYVGYRIGVLRKVYELMAQYGKMPNQDRFIEDCLNCPEISDLLNNSVVEKLDNVGGIPKLILSIYSKYIQHSI